MAISIKRSIILVESIMVASCSSLPVPPAQKPFLYKHYHRLKPIDGVGVIMVEDQV
jgi:hypothetical protein